MKILPRPSLKELEQRISEIEKLDLNTLDIDEIKSMLKLIFTHYAITSVSLNDIMVYRGIKYETKPLLFSFLSYPPPEKAKMGRANRAGISVFYCATDKIVPFYELDVQPGERLVISEWLIQKHLLVNNVGYTPSAFTQLKSERLVPDFNLGLGPSEEVSNEGNIMVQNFLARSFSQKIADDDFVNYKLTNGIAERHFSEGEGNRQAIFKALLYPTIRMNANADNLAITQLAIDNGYLQFQNVEYVEVVSVKDGIYTYKILDLAFGINGNEILWKNLKSFWIAESTRELYFAEDGNQVFAYDGQGELINPSQG